MHQHPTPSITHPLLAAQQPTNNTVNPQQQQQPTTSNTVQPQQQQQPTASNTAHPLLAPEQHIVHPQQQSQQQHSHMSVDGGSSEGEEASSYGSDSSSDSSSSESSSQCNSGEEECRSRCLVRWQERERLVVRGRSVDVGGGRGEVQGVRWCDEGNEGKHGVGNDGKCDVGNDAKRDVGNERNETGVRGKAVEAGGRGEVQGVRWHDIEAAHGVIAQAHGVEASQAVKRSLMEEGCEKASENDGDSSKKRSRECLDEGIVRTDDRGSEEHRGSEDERERKRECSGEGRMDRKSEDGGVFSEGTVVDRLICPPASAWHGFDLEDACAATEEGACGLDEARNQHFPVFSCHMFTDDRQALLCNGHREVA